MPKAKIDLGDVLRRCQTFLNALPRTNKGGVDSYDLASDVSQLVREKVNVLEATQTYTIGSRDGKKFFECHVCNTTSHNPTDVLEKYCGKCNAFH